MSLFDPPVDYEALHVCRACKTRHTLAVLPVRDGWVVGVRCVCRNRDGGPLRYSTESLLLPTVEEAERSRQAFLRMSVAV